MYGILQRKDSEIGEVYTKENRYDELYKYGQGFTNIIVGFAVLFVLQFCCLCIQGIPKCANKVFPIQKKPSTKTKKERTHCQMLPIYCLTFAWLGMLVLGPAGITINRRTHWSINKSGCMLAVTFDEFMEGAVHPTGESWIGIRNMAGLLEEVREEVGDKVPLSVKKRFKNNGWMTGDK